MRRIYGWNKNNNVYHSLIYQVLLAIYTLHILKFNDEKSNLTCCYIIARFIKIGEKIVRLVLKNGVKIVFVKRRCTG